MADDVLARKYVEFSQRGMGDVKTYTKQLREEFNRSKTAAAQLKKSLADGSYLKVSKQIVDLRRNYDAMKKSARLHDLIAEHGTFAGSLRHIHERMEGLLGFASKGFAIATAATLGWVTAGMSGTAEAYRLHDAFQYAARGFASTFKPAIDWVTNALYRLGRWFDNLTRQEQDNIRIGAMWVIGITGGIVAVGSLISMVAKLTAAMRLLGLVSAETSTAGLLGRGGLAALGRLGLYGAIAATAIGSIHDVATEQIPQLQKDIKSGHRGAGMGRAAINLGLGMAPNFLQKQITGKNLDELFLGKRSWEMEKNKLEAGEKKKDENQPYRLSTTGGEFGELGSGFDRLQSELMRRGDVPDNAAKQTETMQGIYDLLKEHFGKPQQKPTH